MIQAVKAIFPRKNSVFQEYIMDLETFFSRVYELVDIPKMSLFDITETLKSNGISQCDPKMLSLIIEHKLKQVLIDTICPECDTKAYVNKHKKTTVVTTFGRLNFATPYYSCSKCNIYFDPSAKVLGLKPGIYQYDFQKMAAKIASSTPFAEAAEILNDAYGMDISPDAVHSLTNELGECARVNEIAPDPKIIQDIVDEISHGKNRRPVLVVAADGAMAPVRTEKGVPHCWRENKGVRMYLVDDESIAHVLSWHQICSKAEFIASLQSIKDLNLFPPEKVRVCCLGDGADWIWDGMNTVFPGARQILDYYHCAQHLHDFAKARFSVASEGARWLKQTKQRLFANQGRAVVAGLKRMKLKGNIASERDKLSNYLSKNIERIDYRKAKRGGYPIGSGAIESANKFIGHVRLKRSGAWWKVDSANNVLKLRCARYNKTYDSFFEAYEKENRPAPKQKKPKLALVK